MSSSLQNRISSLLFVMSLLLVVSSVWGQSRPDTAWTRVVGQGRVSEQCHNVFETSDGGIITVGRLQDGPEGHFYGIFHRLSANGDTLWSRRQFGWINGWVEASLLRENDVLIAAGDGYNAAQHSNVLFLSALDSSGDTLWYHEVPQVSPRGLCITHVVGGGYAVGGGGRPNSDTLNTCAFLYRFNESGEFMWSEQYPDPRAGVIVATEDLVALNDSGFILVAPQGAPDTGYRQGTRIIRVDSQGDTVWQRIIHHPTDDVTLKCIEPMAGEAFLFAGYQGPRELGGDLILGKVSLSGTIVWDSVYTISTMWYWQDANLARCRDDGWVIAATHSPNSMYEYAYLLRFNAYGDTLWSWNFGWEGGDNTGRAVTTLSDGGFALAGDSWEYTPEYWRIWTLVVRTEPEESGISDRPSITPDQFVLESVCPNPFNATAMIEFTLKRPAVVQLRLYDVLGRLAAVVYDGWTPAGQHRFPLHASNLASGEYFLEAEAGGVMQTSKIILLR